MPFEITPEFQVAETVNQRFARLIRAGASYERGETCCAVTATARALISTLEQQGIPTALAMKVSRLHFNGALEKGEI